MHYLERHLSLRRVLFLKKMIYLFFHAICLPEHAIPNYEQGTAVFCADGRSKLCVLSAIYHDLVPDQEEELIVP